MEIKNVWFWNTTSQYGAISYFINQMIEGFKACGINADVIKYVDLDEAGHLKGLTDSDLIFSFNGGVNDLGEFRESFNRDGIPCWIYMLDHPYHHYDRFSNIRRKQIVSVMDRKHLEYLENHYPEIGCKVFVAHGGSAAERMDIAFKDKCYDIVFFGTYTKPQSCMDCFDKYDETMKKLLIKIADDVWNGKETTLEDSVTHNFNENHILEKHLFENQGAIVDIMPYLCGLDGYIRNKKRDLLIRTALKAGYEVHVFGIGWEDFEDYEGNNLYIHDNVDYAESLDIMANSKIVLNNMPLLTDGSHDRIFSALACGGICLTDANPYLKENFIDGQDLFYYDWNSISEMPQMIKKIMTGSINADEVIKSGRKKVLEKHMWYHRAKEILEYCRQIEFCDEEGEKSEKTEHTEVRNVLNMMEEILDFIDKNGENIKKEELENLYQDVIETFYSVNEELFQTKESMWFKLENRRDHAETEFFRNWIDYIRGFI